ncbi:DUF1361 domain-containing protein [Paenibacillus flagellatus]|uniref:DUF1361 domain-containing protein n=1 Tax=Paenibacillus flagellatus TaxID=2211139 RepID=A0A2V5KA89_9BACL|nr:DUF1361 domain-containing protein [Paenibacillus flagellatus]PYI56505.1 hypothetical protein DLM86_05905 [Paenibacillus flagellatus]
MDLRRLVYALAAASAVCAAMVALRAVRFNETTYGWLIVPNLALAWIPLAASLLARRALTGRRSVGAAAIVWGIVWLAFYPNAPYIATDLIHLSWASEKSTLYYDLSFNMLAATIGWLLGALSLRLLHVEVIARYGTTPGAIVAAVAIGLGAVGVYLGRVLRWNSWDLVLHPLDVLADSAELLRKAEAVEFIAAFGLFQAALYAVFCFVVPYKRSLLPTSGSL